MGQPNIEADVRITVDGRVYFAEIGRVDDVFLGYADSDRLECRLSFGFRGRATRQGISYKKANQFGELIDNLLQVFEARSWDEIEGKICYVLYEDPDGMISGLLSINTKCLIMVRD